MMRHFAPKILAMIAISFAATASAQDVIQWAPSIDHARALAAQQNKLLLIHFWTPTCGPCKVVDAKVFPSPAVARAINQNFVALKVNADEDKALTKHFGVKQWPTDVISTVDGRALHRMVTDQNAQRYVTKLGTLAQQHALAAKYNPGPAAKVATRNAPTRSNVQPPLGKRQPMALAQVPTISQEYAAAQQQSLAQRSAPQQRSPQPMQQQSALSPTTAAQQPAFGQSRFGDPSPVNSTAMARRPGVDVSMRPGIGLGADQPGYEPPKIGAMVGGMTSQQNQFAANARTAMPTIGQGQANPNMPTVGQSKPNNMPVISQPTTNNMAQAGSQIHNPYVTGKPDAAPIPQPMQVAQVQSQPVQQQTVPSRFDNSTPVVTNQFAATPAPTANQFAPNQGPAANQVPAMNQAPASTAPLVASAPKVQPRRAVEPEASSIGVAQSPPVGLDGRCPVWLITKGQWKKGNKQFGAIHRGQTYLFTSKEAQQTFLNNPDEFSPVLAGMDVVRLASGGTITQGTRRFGILFDDDGAGPRKRRMYLFDSVESRNQFESEPDRYLEPVMQAMQDGRLDQFLR